MKIAQYFFFFLLALTLLSCSDSGTDPDPTFYDVTVTLTPGGAGTVGPAADSAYEAGSRINLQATANEGYEFTGWSGDVESSDNPLSLTVDQNYSLTANFTQVQQFNVSVAVEPDGAGTISPAADSAYTEGSMIDLEASAEEGFVFDSWTGDVKSTDNPLPLTVDQMYSLTANFIDTDELFVLAENGVTIMCPEAEPGQTGMADGTEYEAVDRDLLDQKFIDGADLSAVCTSPVTDMASLFRGEEDFNQDISSWDVSNVTNMNRMFSAGFIGAPPLSFNQDISLWDVSNVTNMYQMFNGAEAFNRDISRWDVSSVTDMSSMFRGAINFNQDISGWDVSSVTNMRSMFQRAASFNQHLNNWNVSNVKNMSSTFGGAANFNGDISDWDVSSVTDMSFLFSQAENFNQDLSNWNVREVEDMLSMFKGAVNFNGDIKNWEVGNVEDMLSMFKGAEKFNQNISRWDVSSVTDMRSMFNAAASFNQDLSGWCVQNISDEPDDFSVGSPLSELYHPVWGTCPQ